MERYLSLSRAARLVGIKRGTLQKRIQDGDILTFEGMVSVDELLKAYPQTQLADNSMLERSEKIKAAAVGKILHDTGILPSSGILASRVKILSKELNQTRSQLDDYVNLIDELRSRLDKSYKSDEINDLQHWLEARLESPPTNNYASAQLIANDALLSLMTAHVRILPSGHDFFVEGTSSLLEAGLRSGLALDYACSNGNCGKCMARLVSGEINQIQQHDYIITETLKNTGHFLMCCHAAVTDVVIDAHEACGASEIPEQQITAKVKKVEFPNDDIALVHLKTPRTNRLRFLAGQTVNLTLPNSDISADHSVASCPCDDMNLLFQIPRIKRDRFSDYVFNQLNNCDALDINGPQGCFVLDEDSYRSLIFIAWHSGFASIKSLIEHAMALDVAETIHLYWIAPSPADRYMENLCRSWTDALDNFYYQAVDAEIRGNDDHCEQVLQKITADFTRLQNYDVYIAGKTNMITNCKSVLIEHGLPPEQLKADPLDHD